MRMLSHKKAVAVLAECEDLVRLAEAVGVLLCDPATTPRDWLPGLSHPGFIAEQAAIALHKITKTDWDHGQPILDPAFWSALVKRQSPRVRTNAHRRAQSFRQSKAKKGVVQVRATL